MRKLTTGVLSTVALLCTLGGVSLLVVSQKDDLFNTKIRDKIKEKLEVREDNGDAYTGFVAPEKVAGPMRASFFLYTIENSPEDINAGKPFQLKEVGPFVYDKIEHRTNLVSAQGGSTIVYDTEVKYEFRPELSVGSPSDFKITTLNVPLIAALKNLESKPARMTELFKIALQRFPAGAVDTTVTRTVDELLWGYEDPLLVQLQKTTGAAEVPSTFFQLQYDNSVTTENEIVVDQTVLLPSENHPEITYTTNGIVRIGGQEGAKCFPKHTITSSDGRRLPVPGRERSLPNEMSIFAQDLNRPLTFDLIGERDVTFRAPQDDSSATTKELNAKIARYNLAFEPNFGSVADFPSNEQFAALPTRSGLMNLSPCTQNAPIFASPSRFDGLSESERADLTTNVESVDYTASLSNPTTASTSAFIDFEAYTGVTTHARVDLQVNVDSTMKDWSAVLPDLPGPAAALVPLTRVVQEQRLPDAKAISMLTPLYDGLRLVDTVQTVGAPVGIAGILAGALVAGYVLLSQSCTKKRFSERSLLNSNSSRRGPPLPSEAIPSDSARDRELRLSTHAQRGVSTFSTPTSSPYGTPVANGNGNTDRTPFNGPLNTPQAKAEATRLDASQRDELEVGSATPRLPKPSISNKQLLFGAPIPALYTVAAINRNLAPTPAPTEANKTDVSPTATPVTVVRQDNQAVVWANSDASQTVGTPVFLHDGGRTASNGVSPPRPDSGSPGCVDDDITCQVAPSVETDRHVQPAKQEDRSPSGLTNELGVSPARPQTDTSTPPVMYTQALSDPSSSPDRPSEPADPKAQPSLLSPSKTSFVTPVRITRRDPIAPTAGPEDVAQNTEQ